MDMISLQGVSNFMSHQCRTALIDPEGKSNFFERQVSEYSRAGFSTDREQDAGLFTVSGFAVQKANSRLYLISF